ncbi:MAG: flavin oxidoreductase [Spirochaetes bacterium GWD1_61_31]|nr:MAG: flavin oxidoreductase [Spirochaetes bacterium GWB1_60_80]OHD30693.1 MAG: flavin oxidoreductase [Spirochaetes bacterium GWC1_61_12]OHD41268.1 MAG: flavin oxidoreductase [Spirochaetes bacterium GWD1_61_31]OHD45193.1 MAG: flavin oxidoreductase [Spirochaetes bacterium GWE1_60_18]OHD60167.1 MAG: flavin oxidoreductase [Spirochaetes bacterium GWF1_60_12]HAX36917.1 flavin oxidoreductase [Spirochaetaceae bacterium]
MNTGILFEPIQVGNVELKNRIAMSPMNMGYTGPEGYASEQTNAWYATRARGGFGLIITECAVANPYPWRGSDGLNPLLADSQKKYRQLSQMADVIHSYKGAKVFIQLSPGWGRQGHPDLVKEMIAAGAPSAIPLEMDLRNINHGWARQIKRLGVTLLEDFGGVETLRKMSDEEYQGVKEIVHGYLREKLPEFYHIVRGQTPRELTIREIEQLEDFMVDQACACYKLGFDGVELHTPHGYLLHQFLSPRSNARSDRYGGSTENRARVVTNILERIRARIGPDKALGCRLSGDELMPGGLTHDETCALVKLFSDAGANFFNVSQGSYENPGAAFAPDGEDEFTRWAPGIKAASAGRPVITPGFLKPQTAAAALAGGRTDLISLGRQAIADPYWPAKVKAGRSADIVACARCQQCYMNLFEPRWIRCAVNPTAGFEKYYPELWQDEGLMDVRAKSFMDKRRDLPRI